VTFEQATLAKVAGFATEMRYLAWRDFARHVERVKARADAGVDSASEATLLQTQGAAPTPISAPPAKPRRNSRPPSAPSSTRHGRTLDADWRFYRWPR